jgi:hypothetical protein
MCSKILFNYFLKYNTKNWTHLKRRHFSYIIYNDNGMNISVIMLYHRLPKPFLACSVPQLQLKMVSILEIGECYLHKNKTWLGKCLLEISQPKIVHTTSTKPTTDQMHQLQPILAPMTINT